MIFASVLSSEDQVLEVGSFLRESLVASLDGEPAEDFEGRLEELAGAADADALLELLLSLEDLLFTLPVQPTNSRPCSLQRAFLSLTLLENLSSSKDHWKKALQLIDKAGVALPVKVNLALLLYNARAEDDPAKATLLLTLAEFCQRESQLGIMKKNLENIDTVSKAWKLDRTDRLDLYRKSADLLLESGDELAAFRVYQAYANRVDVKNVSHQDFNALRSFVLYGVKVPVITQLGEIRNQFAVKKLVEKEAAYGDMLDSLVTAQKKDLAAIHNKHKQGFEKVKCTLADLEKKKQYIEISKLDKSEYSFADLQGLLGIEEVEEWILEAVSEGMIDAKVDQAQEKLQLRSQTLGVAAEGQWKQLDAHVKHLKEKLQKVEGVLA